MGDPWGTGGFRGGGIGLDGANRKKKIGGKISKIDKIGKKSEFFFPFFFRLEQHWK